MSDNQREKARKDLLDRARRAEKHYREERDKGKPVGHYVEFTEVLIEELEENEPQTCGSACYFNKLPETLIYWDVKSPLCLFSFLVLNAYKCPLINVDGIWYALVYNGGTITCQYLTTSLNRKARQVNGDGYSVSQRTLETSLAFLRSEGFVLTRQVHDGEHGGIIGLNIAVRVWPEGKPAIPTRPKETTVRQTQQPPTQETTVRSNEADNDTYLTEESDGALYIEIKEGRGYIEKVESAFNPDSDTALSPDEDIDKGVSEGQKKPTLKYIDTKLRQFGLTPVAPERHRLIRRYSGQPVLLAIDLASANSLEDVLALLGLGDLN